MRERQREREGDDEKKKKMEKKGKKGRKKNFSPDHVVDEADRLGGPAAERARRDRVDAHAPLAAGLPREHARVGLERGLGGGHAATF